MVIGLTGQSGSGKTTVSEILSKQGFCIINCDKLARQVTQKDSPGLEQIVRHFGDCILAPDHSLDRHALAQIVFDDTNQLDFLNQLIHPLILEQIGETLKQYGPNDLVVLDAPTLFESGADRMCDLIVSVICDEKTRLDRIVGRDKITKSEGKKRMKAQYSQDFFVRHSDYVVANNRHMQYLERQVGSIADEIKNKAV